MSPAWVCPAARVKGTREDVREKKAFGLEADLGWVNKSCLESWSFVCLSQNNGLIKLACEQIIVNKSKEQGP